MRRWMMFAVVLLTAMSASAAALQREQQSFSEKMIRLHVVANSNSDEDQAIKLQVRDAVLEAAEGVTRATLPDALPKLQIVAEDCLRSLGSSCPVTVSLGSERFPTRVYDNFSLPAGVYTALRVTIGAGEGENWWCVAFPSICFRATAADLEHAAVSAGFTEQEVALITEAHQGYVLKFKVLELLEQLKEWLFYSSSRN